MLVPSTRFVRRAKTGSLGAMGIGSVVASRHQRVRGFRFGRPWTYYPEPESRHGDVYRRGRCFRYKYMEIKRGADGARHLLAEDPRAAIVRFVRDYWPLEGKKSRSKDSNVCSAFRTPDNTEGVRPGQNIEDAERAPLEDLLFGKYSQQPSGETEYDIDPITNRKVPKRPSEAVSSESNGAAETSHRTFKSYRSRFPSLSALVIDRKAWVLDALPETGPGRDNRRSVSEGDAPAQVYLRPGKPILDAATSHREPVLESERYVADLNNSTTKSQTRNKDTSQADSDSVVPASGGFSASWWRHDSVPYHPEFDKEGSALGQAPYLSGFSNDFRSPELDSKYNASGGHAVDPEELKKYKPFRSHEPDGKYAAGNTELGLDASEMARYSEPYLSHEPDGKYAESPSKPSASDAELLGYQSYKSHEPNGKYASNSAESSASANELLEYEPFPGHEPDGKHTQLTKSDPEMSDLANHEAFGYEDSETRRFPLEGLGDDEPVELRKYGAMCHAEPDGLPEPDPEEVECNPDELEQDGAVKWNDPDGKPIDQAINKDALFGYDLRDASTHPPPKSTEYRKMLESFMAQSAAVSDAVDADASSGLKQSRERFAGEKQNSSLTGYYARDFPEEFSRSWKAGTSGPGHILLPADLNASDVQHAELQGTQKAALRPGNALQPALERHRLDDKTPAEEPPKKADELSPTLYKVLVYDPTMQCIDTAETTSVVADNANPLTPAEVLLRISNPSKFLPHFGPLQSQGFEIVSGAGDVLIFRKVREAASSGVAAPSAAAELPVAAPTPARPAVNPIDMTGGPRDYTVAASRFASPTGFVNYDLPPPRFPSGIDVRQEEPVFSGPKEEPKGGKNSLPKRLVVGAVWVAGISYSLGVVGEYFRTGGQDGKSHKGL